MKKKTFFIFSLLMLAGAAFAFANTAEIISQNIGIKVEEYRSQAHLLKLLAFGTGILAITITVLQSFKGKWVKITVAVISILVAGFTEASLFFNDADPRLLEVASNRISDYLHDFNRETRKLKLMDLDEDGLDIEMMALEEQLWENIRQTERELQLEYHHISAIIDADEDGSPITRLPVENNFLFGRAMAATPFPAFHFELPKQLLIQDDTLIAEEDTVTGRTLGSNYNIESGELTIGETIIQVDEMIKEEIMNDKKGIYITGAGEGSNLDEAMEYARQALRENTKRQFNELYSESINPKVNEAVASKVHYFSKEFLNEFDKIADGKYIYYIMLRTEKMALRRFYGKVLQKYEPQQQQEVIKVYDQKIMQQQIIEY
ncbi:MAG: hypothetical protein COA57_09015 [Flavobacteriales bacterium]|nr:MAG: hypothetical protein COA57_09015 [Flavobacteriales bacterium]